jgi:Gpi18-like mannosyltransferase
MAAGLGLRLWALRLEGHGGDISIIHGWAERLADVWPWGFYEGHLAVYPALLYLYWPLGVLLDGEALDVVLKGSSIPFDLAIGLLLWFMVRRGAGEGAALGTAVLYLLNPAVIIAGPMWGQVDAAGTLLLLAALMATAGTRWASAGSLIVLAGMTKPQFGLAVILVAVSAYRNGRERRSFRPLLRAATAGVVTYGVVAAPLLLHPIRYADQLGTIALSKPMTSLFAMNPWGLFIGFEKPDGNLVYVGGALLLAGLLGAAALVWRRQDLATLLAAAALMAFAVYFLPTRVHERYLFPAMALLAPFAAVSFRSLAAYLVMTAAFAASLLYALSHIDRGVLAPWLYDVLRAPPSVWIIGLSLMGAALVEVWLLLRPRRVDPVSAPRGSRT